MAGRRCPSLKVRGVGKSNQKKGIEPPKELKNQLGGKKKGEIGRWGLVVLGLTRCTKKNRSGGKKTATNGLKNFQRPFTAREKGLPKTCKTSTEKKRRNEQGVFTTRIRDEVTGFHKLSRSGGAGRGK